LERRRVRNDWFGGGVWGGEVGGWVGWVLSCEVVGVGRCGFGK